MARNACRAGAATGRGNANGLPPLLNSCRQKAAEGRTGFYCKVRLEKAPFDCYGKGDLVLKIAMRLGNEFLLVSVIPGNNNCDSPELPHGAGPDIFIQYSALGWGSVQPQQLKKRAQRRPAMGSPGFGGWATKGGIFCCILL